ncbi:Uncharacterised protein [Morganella morganii]|nr:Uncharacterised protein [Morganella morganii]
MFRLNSKIKINNQLIYNNKFPFINYSEISGFVSFLEI